MDRPQRSGPRSRVRTWDIPQAAAAWPSSGGLLTPYAARLVKWAAAEVTPGRLLPWMAISFGFGIVLYFTAATEPSLVAATVVTLAGAAATVGLRARPFAFPLTLGVTALVAGFTTATLKTALIAHPVLPVSTYAATLSGFVEMREERERSDRITIRVRSIDIPRVSEKPERVRVAVRKGTAPAVGTFVEMKARLSPPLQPLRPGGYDFARDMYFQRIGASGFALGAIRVVQPPEAPDLRLRAITAIDSIRDGLDKRIRLYLPGDKGAIASALITGKRDAITAPVNDAMYVSSLAHVLSISGYHMAVVAGIVFFVVRAGLALSPTLATRQPIKKWAAGAALAAAAAYLVLSGAEVATQRSFIMIAIVLSGVLLDRPALTMRTLTVAAFAVLLIIPEAVIHPSFQMSFAATLALVAAYQYSLKLHAGTGSSLATRAALWGSREIAGLVLASAVAGLATMPYAAFHFHRLAPYGVIANLTAMPVVSVFVMPMGILGLVMMPFGFDGIFWQAMGFGLDWMILVALWVASLPGAIGRMAAFGTGPLLLGTLGLVIVCLLRSPLRWTGALMFAIAAVLAFGARQPDALVSPDGQAVAVRAANGNLSISRAGSDTFAVRDWLGADGDARTPDSESLKEGVRCDSSGCTLRLSDGRLVAHAQKIDAFEEDCARASLIVSPREAPAFCRDRQGTPLLIDRRVSRASGAIALYRQGDGQFARVAARPAGYDRPWAPAVNMPAPQSTSAVARAAPDATPPPDGLDAEDSGAASAADQ